ncbi:MAG TPA: hypothetical protein VN376_06470 [Longilinea sp.]|nr:hypothetical protein [Longilinea sp.]
MRTWNLTNNDPLELTLAADARLDQTDYFNDLIWQLSLRGGDSPVLDLYSTFGLRARSVHFFPRFWVNDRLYQDPNEFSQPITVTRVLPNLIRLEYSPVPGFQVTADYRAYSSHTLTGRFAFLNRNDEVIRIALEWCGILAAGENSVPLAAIMDQQTLLLKGSLEDLYVTCAISGGPVPSRPPYAGLRLECNLAPGKDHAYIWGIVVDKDADQAQLQARQFLKANWEAETARIELVNESQIIEIETGNPEWDAILHFAQKTAFSAFQSPTDNLPNSSFVLNRLPDQGNISQPDGRGAPTTWSGQTSLDTLCLANLILPGGAGLLRGVLDNFVVQKNSAGGLDWRPGLAGQTGKLTLQPHFASLAWMVYQAEPSSGWLGRIYPALVQSLRTWFDKSHDRDQDGLPEWEHPLQTGLENNPLYDRWQVSSQGLEISLVEDPALVTWLLEETDALIDISRVLAAPLDLPWLEKTKQKLTDGLMAMYNAKRGYHCPRDRQTHTSAHCRTIAQIKIDGQHDLQKDLEQPEHILIRITTAKNITRSCHIRISGSTAEGAVEETFSPRSLIWRQGIGWACTQKLFSKIDSVELRGLQRGDTLRMFTPDYTHEEISLLLPLRSGLCSPAQIRSLESKLLEKLITPYGVATLPAGSPQTLVSPFWNGLILEGLVKAGSRQKAAGIMTSLMDTIAQGLKKNKDFRAGYNTSSGTGFGEMNHIHGLPPLRQFLLIAGVEQLSNQSVQLQGFNTFPAVITVQYRGTRITLRADSYDLNLPNGKNLHLTGPGPHLVNFYSR